MSRLVLAHESRQARSWLIFDVSQKMKFSARRMFGWLPIIFQFLAMSSALGAISFATHALDTFVIEHREGLQIPRPTRLLVGHSLLAETIVVALFGVSLFSFWLTPRVVKEEVDRQLIHGAVVGFVWLVGVNYTAGVLMAALLPFFAHRT